MTTATETPVILYTSAPEDYDWGWAKTLVRDHSTFGAPSDTKPRVLRKVEVTDKYHADMQYGRYLSGMNTALTQEEYEKWTAEGYVKPCDDPKPFFRTQIELPESVIESDDFYDHYTGLLKRLEDNEAVKTDARHDGDKYILFLEVFNDEPLFNEIIGGVRKAAGIED